MDKIAIQDTIEELLNSDTTLNNVTELASLLIVSEHLNRADLSRNSGELDDILPAYNKYVDAKRKYQLGTDNEIEVVRTLNLLCKEIQEFIEDLYSGTSMGKERREIFHIIEEIHTKLCKND